MRISVTILVFTACMLIAAAAVAQDIPAGGMQSQRTGAIPSSPGQSARGTMLIDPDDYDNCTGFLLNRLFLASGDFYLDMRDYLNLTGDQVAELREIRLDFVRDTAELESELSIALVELEDLFDRGGNDADDIGMKIDDVYDLEAEYQIARIEALSEARKILTDEQRKTADMLRRRGMVLQGFEGNSRPGR